MRRALALLSRLQRAPTISSRDHQVALLADVRAFLLTPCTPPVAVLRCAPLSCFHCTVLHLYPNPPRLGRNHRALCSAKCKLARALRPCDPG